MSLPKSLALVPCRTSSTRLPRKNLRPFLGKPCYQWVLDDLKSSVTLPTIVLLSDEEEVVNAAKQDGVIGLLSPELCREDDLFKVGREVLAYAEEKMGRFDLFGIFYACAPLRPKGTHDLLLEPMLTGLWDRAAIVSPVPLGSHPWTHLQRLGDGRLVAMPIGNVWINSQLFPPVYQGTACGSLTKREYVEPLVEDREFIRSLRTFGIVYPYEETSDIDTAFDAEWVEFLMRRRQEKENGIAPTMP